MSFNVPVSTSLPDPASSRVVNPTDVVMSGCAPAWLTAEPSGPVSCIWKLPGTTPKAPGTGAAWAEPV